MEGLCVEELKLLGPVQVYVALVELDAVSCRFWPAHNGPLLETEGAAGCDPILMVVEPACDLHPPTITLTVYDPAFTLLTLVITGF